MIKNLFPFQVNQFEVKQLTKDSFPEIQTFLNLFDDFFQLCEGEKGSALGLLKACPPTKNIHQDKFVLGFFDRNNLVGLIDLIANYPEKNTWTTGYFFIHPSYQHQGLGAQFFHALEGILAPQKMRCVVQKQNENALKFWQAMDFKIVSRREECLGQLINTIFVLEKSY
ncbi:Acetyltransferase (GNAT) family [Legionella busanensis]|uniref:Acetyltransferase (GNAT) family n=1 Tax=Legionella busanensis TaxID=190655 RepID=A0A378KAY5_9GAMM|nr:GNAT family N-acetyltransferase [Legionella busanensis]STX81490.1 Acetyltransferase (GNAT) family [Legionella busanensis]